MKLRHTLQLMCLVYALGKNPDRFRVFPKTSALQRINYPFALFSKREIVWSFLSVVNLFSFFGCGGVLILMGKYFQLH
jgi:hypothetical protein